MGFKANDVVAPLPELNKRVGRGDRHRRHQSSRMLVLQSLSAARIVAPVAIPSSTTMIVRSFSRGCATSTRTIRTSITGIVTADAA